MGGKPRANGHGPKMSWAKPPPVKIKSGHHCGVEGIYTGMSRLVPGGDVWLVAFRCAKCSAQWSETMPWEVAKKIRIRAYALEGRELCHCGDPVLDKDGKTHRHDDVKKEGAEA